MRARGRIRGEVESSDVMLREGGKSRQRQDKEEKNRTISVMIAFNEFAKFNHLKM